VTVVYVLNHGLQPQIVRLKDTPYVTEIKFTALQIQEVFTAVTIPIKHNMEIETFCCSTARARHIKIMYQKSFI